MKLKRITSLGLLFSLAPAASLFAYTATFEANDTQYLWTDLTIWDDLPSADGQVVLDAGGHTGSTILLKDTDLSANQYNTIVNDGVTFTIDNSYYRMRTINTGNIVINNAIVNAINGSTFDVQASNYANVVLNGSGVLNIDNSTFNQTSFGNIIGSGTSQFIFANGSTTNQPYGQFMFSDSAQVIIDNAEYNKTIWATSVFSNNSKLVVKNGGYFNNSGSHVPDVYIEFRDNAVLDLQSGGRLAVTAGTNAIAFYDDAKAELSGAGSALSSINGIYLNDRAQINIREGATMTVAQINSLNINSDDSGVNFYSNATWAGGAANAINLSNGSINFKSGTTLTRNGDGNYIIVGSNTKLNFESGSTYDASANASFQVQDNAVITFDGATYNTSSFGRLRIYGGELNFNNGSTTTGTFMNVFMEGAGKLNIDGAGTVFGQTQYNGEHWTIKENAQINITNGGLLRANGNHGDVVNLVLSDNAQLNVNGGSFTFDKWANTQRIQLGDNSSALVKGTAAQKGAVTIGFLDIESNAASGLASLSLGGYGELKVLQDINLGSGITGISSAAQRLSVSGTGNALTFVNLNIQGDSQFKIEGSGSTISGSGALNFTEGEISFVADASGISTLSLASITAFDGTMVLDFSRYLSDESFQLVSTTGYDWSAFVADTGKWNQTDVYGGQYSLRAEADGLWMDYIAVPEPSTYAAVLGAFALAISAYRRRKF